jgi:hypothetical protein
LVDEFVDYVPEPLLGEVEGNRAIGVYDRRLRIKERITMKVGRTEEVVEEFAAIFVGVESVVDIRLEAGVYVAVI